VTEVRGCLRTAHIAAVEFPAHGAKPDPPAAHALFVIANPTFSPLVVEFARSTAAAGRLARELRSGGAAAGRLSRVATVIVASLGPVSDSAWADVRRCAFGAAAAPAARTIVLPPTPASPFAAAPPPPRLVTLPGLKAGEEVAAQSGCEGCHRFDGYGNSGPGPDLSDVGDELSRKAILHALVDPTQPMPSFRNLPAGKLRALVIFLSEQRRRP